MGIVAVNNADESITVVGRALAEAPIPFNTTVDACCDGTLVMSRKLMDYEHTAGVEVIAFAAAENELN